MSSTELSGNGANIFDTTMKVNLAAVSVQVQILCDCHNTSGHLCQNGNGSHLGQCVRRAAYTVLTFMQEIVNEISLSGLVCVLNLDIPTSLARLLSILVLHKDGMHMNQCSS